MVRLTFNLFRHDGMISITLNGVVYDYYLDGTLVSKIQNISTKAPMKALILLKKVSRGYAKEGQYYETKR